MPWLQKKFCLTFVLAAWATLSGAHAAAAADLGSDSQPPIPPPAPWTVSVTPYGWLPFLTGDVTVRGRTAEIDVNPIEVIEHLGALPWMSYVEARRGPVALYNDIFFAKLGIGVRGVRSLGGLTLDAALGVEFTQTVIEVGGAYEVFKWWSGGGVQPDALPRYTAIDLLVGARYWHQELAINLALAGGLDTTGLVVTGGRAIARAGSVDWVDPVVGARVRHQLAPGRELVLRGDIGGFDVGSKLSWNVLGAYSWHIAARNGVTYAGILGYRLLAVDYEKGAGVSRYEYDVLQHGPLMGLTVSF